MTPASFFLSNVVLKHEFVAYIKAGSYISLWMITLDESLKLNTVKCPIFESDHPARITKEVED